MVSPLSFLLLYHRVTVEPAPQPDDTMVLRQLRQLAILLAFAAVCAYAEHAASIASMSVPEIEGKLQVQFTRQRQKSGLNLLLFRNALSSKISITTSRPRHPQRRLSPHGFSLCFSLALPPSMRSSQPSTFLARQISFSHSAHRISTPRPCL